MPVGGEFRFVWGDEGLRYVCFGEGGVARVGVELSEGG